MSASSIERAALSPAEKRALLAELLRKKVGGQAVEFPLSYGQKALLYLTRLQPGTPVYNTMFVIRVDARISIDVLRTAFQRIIDRHAALRTTYALKGEHFVQQVHATWEADFEACDAVIRTTCNATRSFGLRCIHARPNPMCCCWEYITLCLTIGLTTSLPTN